MSYVGRYIQGETLTLVLQCTDANGAPAAPADAPVVNLRSDTALIKQITMPVLDRYAATGLFSAPVRMDSNFPVGRYSATYLYLAGTYNGLEIDTWEVVAGGDPEGALLSQVFLDRAEAKFLVQQTQAGSLLLRRNPSV